MLWIALGGLAAVTIWVYGLVLFLKRRRLPASSQVADLERQLAEERVRARLLESRLADRPRSLAEATQLREDAARIRAEATRILQATQARGAPLPTYMFNNLFEGLFRDLPIREELLADLERQLREGAQTATTRQGNTTVTRRTATNSDLNELLAQAAAGTPATPQSPPAAPPRAWYERLRDPWPKNETPTDQQTKTAEKPKT